MNNNKEHRTNNLPKQNGFSTPENYFDSVEDDFFAKVAEKSFPNASGYKAPSSYFDTIEVEIMSKTIQQKEVKVISLRSRIRKFVPIAAAASILLFISINFFFKSTSTITIDDISTNEIETWYENGYRNIDNSELVASLNENDLDENDFLNTAIAEADLEEYLTNIESTTIIDEIQ